VPELYGKYIYGDYSSARVWSLEYDGINPTVNTQITTASSSISSFGVDENNELYLVSLDGKIYGFTPTITNVTDKQSVNDFRLMQNFPNPFNPSTKILYSVPNLTGSMSNQSLRVTLKVYDILGNEIVVLVDKEQPAGVYEVEFNSDIINKKSSSGVYFYKLTAGSFLESKKMILLK
jgi:hypothetical protein